jgi:carbamoyl-phosphate synthase small subunit
MELVRADGTVFSGRSLGALREARGEVVLNTGMVGYVEMLTDRSWRGQVLVVTYPLQGNYGVLREPFESAPIQVQALIAHRPCQQPSHHTSFPMTIPVYRRSKRSKRKASTLSWST